jgi:hypothetical protein
MENKEQNWMSGSNCLRKITFVSFLTIAVAFSTHAELRFSSKRLKQIFAMLPSVYKKEIEVKSSSGSGTYFMDAKIIENKRELTFRFNQFNELEHLGFYLIDDRRSSSNISEVYDYLERTFLVSALMKEKYLLAEEVQNKKIEVLYNGNGIKQQNGLSVSPQISLNKETPMKIRIDLDSFKIKWVLGSSNTLEIRIPNDYSLITEKTKDELEFHLLRILKLSPKVKINKERPSKSQLKFSSQNIYILPGEIYSTTPELSSSKYFVVSDSIYPVFSSKYYKESIRNLFLNLIQTELKLNITQKLYGGNDEKFSVNINNFLGNFSSSYKVFFGWQNDTKENLKASIFISNTVYNYNHLLVISSNTKELFKKNGEVEGLFLSYVPREKINKEVQ